MGLFYDGRGNPRRLGTPGQADIAGICPDGIALSVEVKVGRDKPKPNQQDWAGAVIAHNGRYAVIRPDRDGWREELAALVQG